MYDCSVPGLTDSNWIQYCQKKKKKTCRNSKPLPLIIPYIKRKHDNIICETLMFHVNIMFVGSPEKFNSVEEQVLLNTICVQVLAIIKRTTFFGPKCP